MSLINCILTRHVLLRTMVVFFGGAAIEARWTAYARACHVGSEDAVWAIILHDSTAKVWYASFVHGPALLGACVLHVGCYQKTLQAPAGRVQGWQNLEFPICELWHQDVYDDLQQYVKDTWGCTQKDALFLCTAVDVGNMFFPVFIKNTYVGMHATDVCDSVAAWFENPIRHKVHHLHRSQTLFPETPPPDCPTIPPPTYPTYPTQGVSRRQDRSGVCTCL